MIGRRGLVGGRVPRPAAALWRRRVRAAAVDDTAASSARTTVVVATRPGDEVLGCGAVLARKRASGTTVDLVVVTDGRHLNPSLVLTPSALADRVGVETLEAAAMLGIDADHVHRLGFEEGRLGASAAELEAALASLLTELDPAEVLVPSPHEFDVDRRHVAAAVGRALDRGARVRLVLGYGMDSWVDPVPALTARPPVHRLVRADRFLHLQRAALARHRSRTSNPTGELGWRTPDRATLALFDTAEQVLVPLRAAELVAGDPGGPGGPGDPGGSDRPGGPSAGSGPAAPARNGPPIDGVVDAFHLLTDDGDDVAAGAVIGSRAPSGATRLGADAEATVALTGGRLRLGHLDTPGWGRQGVAYGPFVRRPGLTFAARVTNSHHNAHTDPAPRGPRSALAALRRDRDLSVLLRPAIDDNLILGLLSHPVPDGPHGAGNAFVAHAAGPVNGQLRAAVSGRAAPVVDGVQELTLTYVVVLRERGATYYLSGPEAGAGVSPWPWMRPVAVDLEDSTPLVYGGIHQAVHDEYGYETATIVDRVLVVPLDASAVPTPRRLDLLDGAVGAGHGDGDDIDRSEALVELDGPVGLLHAVVGTAAVLDDTTTVGLRWRTDAAGQDGWRLVVGRDRAELAVGHGGVWQVVVEGRCHLPAAHQGALQVLDDGASISVHLDGVRLFDGPVLDPRHGASCHVGVVGGSGGARVRRLEAHPRQVPVPAALGLGAPWQDQGTVVVARDHFEGPAGALDEVGRPHGLGWQRSLGTGRLELSGAGSLRVGADRARPNPDRTAYTVAWAHPDLADVEVAVLPPGTARSQGHGSRGGLVLWQDEANYLVVNVWLDDSPHHDGSAVSFFFHSAGHERMADALWTNVGRQVTWGRRITLRLISDGDHVTVLLDGAAVLQRRLSDVHPGVAPLRITRVGIVANQEWGDDTGTTFFDFTARHTATGADRP